MKRFLLIVLVFNAGVAAHTQCGKTVTWNGSKTEFLDSTGFIKSTDQTPVRIETTHTHITITFETRNGQSESIEGDIKNMTCNWTEAYKNGKTSFTSLMAKQDGEAKKAKILIEAKNGKIYFLLELENMNGIKMRVPIDSYKE